MVLDLRDWAERSAATSAGGRGEPGDVAIVEDAAGLDDFLAVMAGAYGWSDDGRHEAWAELYRLPAVLARRGAPPRRRPRTRRARGVRVAVHRRRPRVRHERRHDPARPRPRARHSSDARPSSTSRHGRGRRSASLTASRMGRGVYARIGFQEDALLRRRISRVMCSPRARRRLRRALTVGRARGARCRSARAYPPDRRQSTPRPHGDEAMTSVNPLLALWRAGKPSLGGWLTTADPQIAEYLATGGFDEICVDQQHGFADSSTLASVFRAIEIHGVAPTTRVPANDFAAIGFALDVGAVAIVVPMVGTADEAAAAVEACHYPPRGRRSVGAVARHARASVRAARRARRGGLCRDDRDGRGRRQRRRHRGHAGRRCDLHRSRRPRHRSRDVGLAGAIGRQTRRGSTPTLSSASAAHASSTASRRGCTRAMARRPGATSSRAS